MRIHDNGAAGFDLGKVGRNPAEQPADAGQGSGVERRRGGTDEVRLSNLAEQIQSLDPASRDMESRLDRLARLVEAGQYKPSAEALAESILDDALAEGASSASTA